MAQRKAMFAGSWYPDTAAACERQIKTFLSEDDPPQIPPLDYTGGIVPHAGWIYSGAIACNVIKRLAAGGDPDLVIIFGMHLHPASPAFLMARGTWETPFGDLPIAAELAAAISDRFDFQIETAGRFTQDNTIELQLPFIKYFCPQAAILPIGVPPVEASLEIGTTLAALVAEKGLKAKVIGSTDLTHYGASYGFAPKGSGAAAVSWVRDENDRAVIEAMLAMDPKAVLDQARQRQNACCAGAAATAIAAAGALGAKTARTVAYATSYDRHPADSFVGYVGIVF